MNVSIYMAGTGTAARSNKPGCTAITEWALIPQYPGHCRIIPVAVANLVWIDRFELVATYT